MIAEAIPRATLRQWLPAAAAAASLSAAIWMTSGGLAFEARAALLIFSLSISAWTLSPADDLLVAGLAVGALLIVGATDPDEIARLFQHELIWLLAASYIIAAAVRRTSLIDRLAIQLSRSSRRLDALFYRLTALVAATAFVIPTTSGRAALLVPVFLAFSDALRHAHATKALSLLFPSVILLSACGVLTGAGAHLIALDILGAQREAMRIGYLEWMVLMLPIALLSSFAATWIIVRMCLAPEERRRRPTLPPDPPGAMTHREVAMLAVLAVTILLWATDGLHGAGLAPVALVSALALTALSGGTIAPQALAHAIEWKLLLFLGATMLLGEALVSTGAGTWIAHALLVHVLDGLLAHTWLVAGLIAALALVSHVLILSRSARAAVLIPVLAIPLAEHGYSVAAVSLLIAVGTGFCQTTRLSAKPLMIYGGINGAVFSNADLMRLSVMMLPVMWLLLFVFAVVVWPALGLELSTANVADRGE
jgi:sodium-dependent dicarboxylate transporter 2/3/5